LLPFPPRLSACPFCSSLAASDAVGDEQFFYGREPYHTRVNGIYFMRFGSTANGAGTVYRLLKDANMSKNHFIVFYSKKSCYGF
jgi:hypothetical protein